ncbi:MAG: FtsQ-type POTRA domain-containing protein [Clostridiales bacterium]
MNNSTVIDVKFKNNKIKKKVLYFLSSLIVIFLLFGIFIKISVFEIEGMVYFDKKEIEKKISVRKNDRLIQFFNLYKVDDFFTLRSNSLEEDIKDIFYVKEVTTHYRIPNKFQIVIKERKPVGYILYNELKLVVDRDGYVIGVNNNEVTEKFPLFDGIELEKFAVGKKVNVKDENKLKLFEIVSDSLNQLNKKEFINKIKIIDISEKDKIFVYFNHGVDSNIGNVNSIDYKMVVLEKLIDKNSKDNVKGTYDFTLSDNPTFIPK